jgi:hypothetical protein
MCLPLVRKPLLSLVVFGCSGRYKIDYIDGFVEPRFCVLQRIRSSVSADPRAAAYRKVFLVILGCRRAISQSKIAFKKTHTFATETQLVPGWSFGDIWATETYSEPDSQYGDGFIVKRYNGTRIIGQAGGWPGVNAQVDYYPDLGCMAVILANYDFDTASSINKLREWLSQGR